MSTGTEMVEAEFEDGGDYETLSVISTAEINQQISTAKKFPRNVKKFLVETKSLATETEEIAGECFYRLKRKDKDGKDVVIEGPSRVFAQITGHEAEGPVNVKVSGKLVPNRPRNQRV